MTTTRTMPRPRCGGPARLLSRLFVAIPLALCAAVVGADTLYVNQGL